MGDAVKSLRPKAPHTRRVHVLCWLFVRQMRPSNLLQSYSAMMAAGLVLGLLSGGLPFYTREVSMLSLALLMTLSLSNVSLREAKGSDHIWHAAKALVVNYVLLTSVILLIALLFSGELRTGWVLMAAAPSAVSVVPFSAVLGGKVTKALFSTAANYAAALVLMPAITLSSIGSAVSAEGLVYSLILLIVLPMVASRGVMKLGLRKEVNTAAMNISFAVLVFAVAGSNRDAFLGEPLMVVAVSACCALRTFGTGLASEYCLRAAKVAKDERVTYVLFASYKNLGLTATLAVALFEPMVAVPATICIVFEVVWVLFLIRWYPSVS